MIDHVKSHYDPDDENNLKWKVQVHPKDLVFFYATVKNCDPNDEWGLLDLVKLDLARHIKRILNEDSTFINEQIENGKLSHALLLEIVTVSLREHSKAKIKGESEDFFHESFIE